MLSPTFLNSTIATLHSLIGATQIKKTPHHGGLRKLNPKILWCHSQWHSMCDIAICDTNLYFFLLDHGKTSKPGKLSSYTLKPRQFSYHHIKPLPEKSHTKHQFFPHNTSGSIQSLTNSSLETNPSLPNPRVLISYK